MALGLITANVGDAGDICRALEERGVDHLMMGTQKSEFARELRAGRYLGLDLRRLGEGRVSAVRMIPRLHERGIDCVVNGGTLTGLLDSAIHQRLGRGLQHLETSIETQKVAALRLEEVLLNGEVDVAWLAERVPEFRAGAGVLNGVELGLPEKNLRAALQRAVSAAAASRVACAWIDDGPGQGVHTFDTDDKLKKLATRPPPSHRRLLIKVAARPDHCPLDPPMVGPPTVTWAREAYVSAILIDRDRGVIVSRERTLREAAEAGIAIIGV